jgi:DNA-binding NarL/FixJ family response regulator
MPLRVLVADDNEIVRSSIVRILEENSDVEVVGQSINYAQTMELASALKPDILLLDLLMPDEDAFTHEAIKLHLLHNAGCILAISVWNDEEAQRRAQNLGAKALIDKAKLYGELNRWIASHCRSDESLPTLDTSPEA